MTHHRLEETAQAPIVSNRGYCHCCRRESTFESDSTWLRDYYFCLNCRSIPRQRHVQHVLDSYYRDWELLDIHESSPSNDFISRHCRSYSSSQFFTDTTFGSEINGVRCESLEQLTFPDNSFDIFITQDVFEHIFNPDRAAQEIMRVLRPGGIHIFTAPKHKGIKRSYPRARMENGNVQYLLEEQYHGNPVGDGRALVTWDYGDDFEFLLTKWGHQPTITYNTKDCKLGLDGEFIEVFVSKKFLS